MRGSDFSLPRYSTFERTFGGFFLNLQTGTALGLTVPPSLLGHADEMISVG